MLPRYTTVEMKKIWSDANRYQIWLDVELAVTAAWQKLGKMPQGLSERLAENAAVIDFAQFATRALEIEETVKHDVIAFLSALEEQLGEESCHIHFGMTSSDVVDTAFALLLQQAGQQILQRLGETVGLLRKRAREFQNTICLGRTHGQAAEPTTFGLKLLSFAAEFDRDRRRLKAALLDVNYGQISGAVGNFGHLDPQVEALTLAALGLSVEPISTQIIPRDRHAHFFSVLAILGGSIERFSVEMRHLMRSEVREAFEPFAQNQKGSSAMPHKRNPILTENLTGQARLLRAYASASLENQALWHERDISHSSVERVIAPDATTCADFSLKRLNGLITGMEVDAHAMAAHVEATGGLIYSEGVLLALIEQEVLRQEAYGWVQQAAKEAVRGADTFLNRLKEHPEIKSRLSDDQLNQIFDAQHHLRHIPVLFSRVEQELDRTENT